MYVIKIHAYLHYLCTNKILKILSASNHKKTEHTKAPKGVLIDFQPLKIYGS